MWVPLLLKLCVVGLAYGQASERSWGVAKFPDPIQNPRQCGREGPSFVCDPENMLPPNKVDLLDELLKDIYNNTAACYSTATNVKGYIVMLAIVPRMEKYFTVDEEDTMRNKYKEAMYFSYFLGWEKKWGRHSNNCEEMVTILYSVYDGVIYTTPRPTAHRLLTDERVREAMLQTLTRFAPFGTDREKVADALTFLVRTYRDYLNEEVASN